jgi:hypothetical protein
VLAEDNSIFNNSQNAVGIWAANDADITITASTITNNPSTYGAIIAKFSDNLKLTVTNNISIANHVRSVGLDNCDNATVIVDNNDYLGNNSSGGVTAKYCEGLNISVTNNTITECDYSGIGLTQNKGPGSIVVGNNSIYNNGSPSYGGLNVQFSSIQNYLNEIVIYSNYFDNNGMNGIGIQDTNLDGDLSIRNNTIINSGYTGLGLRFDEISLVNIVDNYIASNGTSGVEGGGVSLTLNNIVNLSVSNNTITNHTSGATYKASGFKYQENVSLENVVINGNYFFNNRDGGISGELNVCDSLRLKDNSITSSTRGGIEIQKHTVTNYISISNNVISKAGAGVLTEFNTASNIVLADNIVNTTTAFNSSPGIGVQTSEITHITLINNSVTNAGEEGLGVQMCTNVENLAIFSNYVVDSGLIGIGAKMSTISGRIDINNNTAINNGDGGIGLDGSNTSQVGAISVLDNFVVSNDDAGNNWPGLRIQYVDVSGDIEVRRNTTRNNEISGFGFQGGNAGTFFFVDNLVFSHPRVGFGLQSSVTLDNLIFSGNEIRKNGGYYTSDQSGGVGFKDNADITNVELKGNTIANNTGSQDGTGGIGVYGFSGISFTISNNFIYSNTASTIGSDRVGGIGIRSTSTTITIINNEVSSNIGRWCWRYWLFG